MSRRPKQSDVAAIAGVSPGIVSLIINNRLADSNVRVSMETQQRVWDAIRSLGYVVNPVARRLRGGQNRLLGVFTYETIFPLEQNAYSYPFLRGIEQEVQKQFYDLLLFTKPAPDGRRAIFQEGVNSLQLADGAIILSAGHGNDQDLIKLVEEEYPFVVIGRRDLPAYEIPYVAVDNIEQTKQLTSYVIEKGHSQLCYVHGPDAVEPFRDRKAGYILAVQVLNRKPQSYEAPPHALTISWLQEMLQQGVTAFIVESRGHAERIIALASQLQKQVPNDFSLALAGDTPEEENEITAYIIPREEVGRQAVRMLTTMLAQKSTPETPHIFVPCLFRAGTTVTIPPTS